MSQRPSMKRGNVSGIIAVGVHLVSFPSRRPKPVTGVTGDPAPKWARCMWLDKHDQGWECKKTAEIRRFSDRLIHQAVAVI